MTSQPYTRRELEAWWQPTRIPGISHLAWLRRVEIEPLLTADAIRVRVVTEAGYVEIAAERIPEQTTMTAAWCMVCNRAVETTRRTVAGADIWNHRGPVRDGHTAQPATLGGRILLTVPHQDKSLTIVGDGRDNPYQREVPVYPIRDGVLMIGRP